MSVRLSRRVAALGMPELVIGGLSETWLLEQCGDMHWQLLAHVVGSPPAGFSDEHGNRIYAGIVACELSAPAGLDAVREGIELSLNGELHGLRETSSLASIDVSAPGLGGIATVTLLSRFLRRRITGDNTDMLASPPANVSAFAFGNVDDDPVGRHDDALSGQIYEQIFTPSPALDFNGSGLLYFAKYGAFTERTEWHHRAALNLQATRLVSRSISYFGNINPGDSIRVELSAIAFDGVSVRHTAHIFRESDNVQIAAVKTRKGRPRGR